MTYKKLWRVFVSTLGFGGILFIPTMALKELYFEPAPKNVLGLIVISQWLLAFLLAWFVVTSNRVPWPGDED